MGFGSRMIERSLAAPLSRHVTINYEPTGVTCAINAPLDAIRDNKDA
jgi:two-component system CheB/CheR fusion protein